jgi:hypothetical protein
MVVMAYTTVTKLALTLSDGREIEIDSSEYSIIFQGSMQQDSLRHNPRKPDQFLGEIRFLAPAEKWNEWRT